MIVVPTVHVDNAADANSAGQKSHVNIVIKLPIEIGGRGMSRNRSRSRRE